MKATLLSLVLVGVGGSALLEDPKPQDQAPRTVVFVKAADVKWGDHKVIPGAKVCVQSGDPAKGASVVMTRIPKGTSVPAHWHTSDETVTIVAGSAVYGASETVDEAKGVALTAGSYILIPSKHPHWVIAKEDLVISVTLDKPADFNLCSDKK